MKAWMYECMKELTGGFFAIFGTGVLLWNLPAGRYLSGKYNLKTNAPEGTMLAEAQICSGKLPATSYQPLAIPE